MFFWTASACTLETLQRGCRNALRIKVRRTPRTTRNGELFVEAHSDWVIRCTMSVQRNSFKTKRQHSFGTQTLWFFSESGDDINSVFIKHYGPRLTFRLASFMALLMTLVSEMPSLVHRILRIWSPNNIFKLFPILKEKFWQEVWGVHGRVHRKSRWPK